MTDARLPKRRRHHGALTLGVLIAGAAVALPTAFAAPSIAGQMEAVRKLEAEIAGYDARFNQANAAYQGAKAKVAELTGRITTTTAALKKAESDFTAAQRTLSSRLSKIYRQPEPSQVELLLRSTSFSEAIAQVNYLDRVQQQDGRVVVKIKKSKESIAKARVALIADRKEEATQASAAKARLVEVNSIRLARRGVLVRTRAQLTAMIAFEAQRKANAARLAALRGAQQRVTRQIGGAAPPQVAVPVVSNAGSAPSGDVAAKLRSIAQCESGGNVAAVSPSGLYRGKYQFDPGTWASLGGTGDPAAASEAEQDRLAAALYAKQGSSPWPVCGR